MTENCPECSGPVIEAPTYSTTEETYESVCTQCGLVLSEPEAPEPRPSPRSAQERAGSGQRVAPVKICAECQKPFSPAKSWHKYCSTNCRVKASRKRK